MAPDRGRALLQDRTPYLTEAGIWSADAVIEAIREVDERLAMASESGIRAYFAGDFWAATHVLVPQLERSLRETGAKVSAGVYKLIKDQNARCCHSRAHSQRCPDGAVHVIQRRGVHGGGIRPAPGTEHPNNTAHGLYQPGDDSLFPRTSRLWAS